jgi:flagellar basal body-associated protein FliL
VEAGAVADEQAAVEEQKEETPVEAPKRKGRGMFRLIKAVAFVSVIVVVQIVVAKMLAPTPQDTARLAQELTAASHGQSADAQEEQAKDGKGHAGSEQNLHEVELGTYNITRFNPATNTTLAIDFELFGTVLADDVGTFQHHFETNNARIKEQITLTMHSAGSKDLTDAGLGLIKRQILEKTNRALGQPMLKEVLFSKFNFVER